MLTWIQNISLCRRELLRNNPDRIAFLSQADIDRFESVLSSSTEPFLQEL